MFVFFFESDSIVQKSLNIKTDVVFQIKLLCSCWYDCVSWTHILKRFLNYAPLTLDLIHHYEWASELFIHWYFVFFYSNIVLLAHTTNTTWLKSFRTATKKKSLVSSVDIRIFDTFRANTMARRNDLYRKSNFDWILSKHMLEVHRSRSHSSDLISSFRSQWPHHTVCAHSTKKGTIKLVRSRVNRHSQPLKINQITHVNISRDIFRVISNIVILYCYTFPSRERRRQTFNETKNWTELHFIL